MRRRQHGHPTGDSYLVSISDLMAGLLFFFIIALAVLATHYRRQVTPWKDVEYDREWLVRALENDLHAAGLHVRVDESLGVIRVPEEVLFQKNSAELSPAAKEKAAILRRTLLSWLPCLSAQCDQFPACGNIEHPCPPNSYIDTFLVEGHTDSDPVRTDPVRGNWRLSSERAISLYLELAKPEPGFPMSLDQLTRPDGRKIFAVSGYADTRPACQEADPDEACKARNRRIELRVILVPRGAAEKLAEEGR